MCKKMCHALVQLFHDLAGTLVCGGMGREGNLVVDTRIAEFPVLPQRDSPINRECIRNLTPDECERLQGFPTGWTEGVACSHRYRLIANAVIFYNSAILSRLLMKYEASGNAKAHALLTQISPAAWRHILLNGHYTFQSDGKMIDLDALVAGLELG